MSRKVRITKFPDREIEVSDAEYTDLARQGLLVPERVGEPVVEDKPRRATVQPAVKEEN
jgi:hypothetical protein